MLDRLKKMFGESQHTLSVYAPCAGSLQPLSAIGDQVFASGTLGPGLAILPDAGETEIRAPIGGQVMSMSDMSHAVMIRAKGGLEVLVHVGIGTIALRGEHFVPLVKNSDYIKVGDPILRFDAAAIAAAGYSLLTPLTLPFLGDYQDCRLLTELQQVAALDEIAQLSLGNQRSQSGAQGA